MSWSRAAFDETIQPAKGKKLVTLEDAAAYIMKLPKAEQDLPEWQTATEALMVAAEDGGPMMHARIGVMRALNRNVERTFIGIGATHHQRIETNSRDARSTNPPLEYAWSIRMSSLHTERTQPRYLDPALIAIAAVLIVAIGYVASL